MTTAIFKPYTNETSNDPFEQTLRDHAGQRATIAPLDSKLFDQSEVGSMFYVTFPDGFKGEAFADELSEQED
jgi:hypothetical protein